MEFICSKGHSTYLPVFGVMEEIYKNGTIAVHDMGVDRDEKGRQYIPCGWISDSEEETPDDTAAPKAFEEVIATKHDLTKVRMTIKTENPQDDEVEEEWFCKEKAYIKEKW